jgi:hypothetical protein
MANYSLEEVELNTRRYVARLNCYPNCSAGDLSDAYTKICEKYKEVFGHSVDYTDVIRVQTSDDDIILYFQLELGE